MSQSNYKSMLVELKKLRELLIKLYGKSSHSAKKIDRICSAYYGIDMYLNEKNRLNLLILGEISDDFKNSFLKQFFPMGISEIFLKRCENGINKVVFNNVNNYDQIYIALEKQKMLAEDKRLFLENMFELLMLDINLIPDEIENAYTIENNTGLIDFNDHMESILFGDFNEKFSVFYENYMIEKLFITRNFGYDSKKMMRPVNKILWIPNAAIGINDEKELTNITKFIEDTLGFNFYTFVCNYTGEKFIPTIVEKINQNLIKRIGEDKKSFVQQLIKNRCFFDSRIEFKKERDLILDFLTEEKEGKFTFMKENSFDITEKDASSINRFFYVDNDPFYQEIELLLKKDIAEINFSVEKINNELVVAKEDQKTADVKILEILEFLKSMVIIVTDLFDASADGMDIIIDLKNRVIEFESKNKIRLFDHNTLDDLEEMVSEDSLYQTPAKILELHKKIFRIFEDTILKCKIEIKSIQKQHDEEGYNPEYSEIAVEEFFNYVKELIIRD